MTTDACSRYWLFSAPDMQLERLPRQHFVAHSWPKRGIDDRLNHAEWRAPQHKNALQMRLFRPARRWASLCPSRPVTPEVAGSSPVAPVF
jgi:hypothetical protein